MTPTAAIRARAGLTERTGESRSCPYCTGEAQVGRKA